METIEFTLPSYLACYLFNNDPSSLEDNEIKEIDDFLKDQSRKLSVKALWAIDASMEPEFVTYNDLNNIGCDCLTYIFRVEDY